MLIVRGERVVLPDGICPASIHIDNGVIVSVRGVDDVPDGANIVDAGDLVVSPGLVDTHVHINEPGRAEWEGFETATRAAAAGGATTLVDMPLNSVPATTTARALEAKRQAAAGRCHVDVGFWGGVVPGNESALEPLLAGGVRGFKCFLVPSGVEEFPPVDENDLRRAMPALARHGVPLLVHAESPSHVLSPEQDCRAARYRSYLGTRPPEAEVAAIRLVVRLACEYGARVHIVHVAAAEAVAEIARALAGRVRITAETCPHYLTFAAEEIPDGATEYKCAPPIREAAHRDQLWNGLRSRTLGLVVTDHSPAPPALKCAGDFLRAWGGIASLELALPAVWTGARTRGFGVSDLARWMSGAPAALAGFVRKGRIVPGCDADLVLWDPDRERTVDAERLQQRHKLTPYAGRRLFGVVQTTILRGVRVWDQGGIVGPPSGRLL